jgi:hypothetical protein
MVDFKSPIYWFFLFFFIFFFKFSTTKNARQQSWFDPFLFDPHIKRRMSTHMTYIFSSFFSSFFSNTYILFLWQLLQLLFSSFLVLILVATLGCLRNQSHVHVSAPCMQPMFLTVVLFLLLQAQTPTLRNSIWFSLHMSFLI